MNPTELIKKEGIKRGLRPETIKTYITSVNKFLRVYKLDAREITKRNIVNYLEQQRQWGRASSTINVHLMALKFFYQNVLGKKLIVDFTTSRVRKRMPTFLTQEETAKLFFVIKNPKHKLMVKFLYATGMRVSELVSLRVRDFEFNHNYGWIRDGKGGRDRLFVIALKLKNQLLAWISAKKLKHSNWLFSGQGSSHISSSTIREIVKKAAKESKVNKNVSPHTLRHSFATHLIENGYAVTEVQPLLGHGSINTTMIYLHMASPNLLSVQSPYDSLAT